MKRARSRSESRFYLFEWTVKPEYAKRLKAADRPNFEDIADIVDGGGGDIVASRSFYLGYDKKLRDSLLSFAYSMAQHITTVTSGVLVVTEEQVESLPLNSKTRQGISSTQRKSSAILEDVYKSYCEQIGDLFLSGILSYYGSLLDVEEQFKSDKTFGKMKRHLAEIEGVNNQYIKELDHWIRLDPKKTDTKRIHIAFYSTESKFLYNGYLIGKTVYYSKTYYWTKKMERKGKYWIYKIS